MHDKCMWSQKSVEKFVQQSVERCTAAPYFNSTDATIRKHIESFFKAADYVITTEFTGICGNKLMCPRLLRIRFVSHVSTLDDDVEISSNLFHHGMHFKSM